jgi:predicted nucleic acid-binding protein
MAEVGAALAVKHRVPGGITLRERDSALSLFLSHCQSEYELISVSRLIVDLAVRLTQDHKLRGYDAVQLASALVTNQTFTAAGLSSLTFIAADSDLLTAAQAEGLSIDNPNLHP